MPTNQDKFRSVLTVDNEQNSLPRSVFLAAGSYTLNADGSISIGAQEQGTFTASFTTGFTTPQTMDFSWVRTGRIVTLESHTLMSAPNNNAAIQTAAGALPAAIRPARALYFPWGNGSNNSVQITPVLTLETNGQIRIQILATSPDNRVGLTAWAATGTAVVNAGSGGTPNTNVTYSLN